MKLLVLSDLHLEFADFEPDEKAVAVADVVVLAGDIHQGTEGISWARKMFPKKPVIYIAGNHEFYGFHWDKLLNDLRKEAAKQDIHFLENGSVSIDGVRFLGTTLWTDFDFFGRPQRSKMMGKAEGALKDYDAISAGMPPAETSDAYEPKERLSVTVGPGGEYVDRLTAAHTLLRHQESLAWLKSEFSKGASDKTVVVTHHYPHKNSTAPEYANDDLTPAFGSKLPADVLVKARLWIHGHSHGSSNYRVGDSKASTRVICNPRGYPLGWHASEMENLRFDPGLLLGQLDDGSWEVLKSM